MSLKNPLRKCVTINSCRGHLPTFIQLQTKHLKALGNLENRRTIDDFGIPFTIASAPLPLNAFLVYFRSDLDQEIPPAQTELNSWHGGGHVKSSTMRATVDSLVVTTT